LLLPFALVASSLEATDVIRPDEVAPGSSGVCVTEMDGGEVVEIPLTVIGTVGPWAPEGEIVLVRLTDERFEHTGIIAGMSGSPVYVDGKLLGALAFGWSFAKEPIGGVTPFFRMESLAEGRASAAGGTPGRPTLAEIVDAGRRIELGSMLSDWLLPETGVGLHGLPLAVTSSGPWDPEGKDWLSESWRRLGWTAVPGGGTSDVVGGTVAPGSMVAGVLADGDAVLAAGGTVTEVRGSQVWAFGHPFLGGGSFRIPLARARVVSVLPSQASSFKFFSVGETIGSIDSDRSRGIWGRLGEAPAMVPVRVVVDGRPFEYRAVRHSSLTPFIVAYLTQTSQAARGRLFGDQTIDFRIELAYRNHETAVYRESLASAEAPAQATALAAGVIAYLENAVFEVPELESVAIELTTEERVTGAELIDVVPRRRTVEPGEVLSVRLRLRPFRGNELSREAEIRVPAGIPEGPVDLVVADGASWSLYDFGMRPFRAASFEDEVRLVNRLVPSTTVVMVLERREPGVALGGGPVSMPPGLVVQLGTGLGPNLTATSYAVSAKTEQSMGIPVVGAERIALSVRSEDRTEQSEVP
jgi:hypothetical protein